MKAGGSEDVPAAVAGCEPDKSDNTESMRYMLELSSNEVVSRIALPGGDGIFVCNGTSIVSTAGRSLIFVDESGVVIGGVLGVVGVGIRASLVGVPSALRKKPPPDLGGVAFSHFLEGDDVGVLPL